MINKIIDCCKNCPFFYGPSGSNPSECTHPISEKRGAYENIVPRSNFKPEPIPKWCPIKEDGYLKVNRNINDKVISKIKYTIKQ